MIDSISLLLVSSQSRPTLRYSHMMLDAHSLGIEFVLVYMSAEMTGAFAE